MGRCYEFGVAVREGCEHAMAVVPEGGACGCETCGTRCPGRFAGCAAIVAKPGYKPQVSPERARPVPGRRPAAALPTAATATAGEPATASHAPTEPNRPALSQPNFAPSLGDVETELAAIRDFVEKLLERPDRTGVIAEAIKKMDGNLGERDNELVAAFDRLHDSYDALVLRLNALGDAQNQIHQTLTGVQARLAATERMLTDLQEALEQRPGSAGRPGGTAWDRLRDAF